LRILDTIKMREFPHVRGPALLVVFYPHSDSRVVTIEKSEIRPTLDKLEKGETDDTSIKSNQDTAIRLHMLRIDGL